MLKVAVSLFILGLSFGSGPCLASCGPLLLSYIVGTQKKVSAGLLTYSLFSIARIAVYIALAILVFFSERIVLDSLLAGISRYIFILGGTFIILLGILIILGKSDSKCCVLLKNKFLEHDKKSIILLGIITAILPCAPLIAMLSYLGLVSLEWRQSLLGALSFGVGVFISPLILLSALGGLFRQWLKDREVRILNYLCGIIIIVLGLQLLRRAF